MVYLKTVKRERLLELKKKKLVAAASSSVSYKLFALDRKVDNSILRLRGALPFFKVGPLVKQVYSRN